MRASDIREALTHEVASLPDALAQEALDFILFVKARHAEEQHLWAEVERTRAHRAEHPEEVVVATADEFDAATAHFDEKP